MRPTDETRPPTWAWAWLDVLLRYGETEDPDDATAAWLLTTRALRMRLADAVAPSASQDALTEMCSDDAPDSELWPAFGPNAVRYMRAMLPAWVKPGEIRLAPIPGNPMMVTFTAAKESFAAGKTLAVDLVHEDGWRVDRIFNQVTIAGDRRIEMVEVGFFGTDQDSPLNPSTEGASKW